MMLMATAVINIVNFLGLVYDVDTGLRAVRGLESPCAATKNLNEAAIKYFLLGAFSTGFLLLWDRARLRRDWYYQARPDS